MTCPKLKGLETALDRKDLADLMAFLCLDEHPRSPTAKLIPGAPKIKRNDGVAE